jgi:ABC-2 type transport system ATP-binding protein
VRVRDAGQAQRALAAAGQPAELLADGTLELKGDSSIQHPEDISVLLVKAGAPPTRLTVEEEELEEYFLRLIGTPGGLSHE